MPPQHARMARSASPVQTRRLDHPCPWSSAKQLESSHSLRGATSRRFRRSAARVLLALGCWLRRRDRQRCSQSSLRWPASAIVALRRSTKRKRRPRSQLAQQEATARLQALCHAPSSHARHTIQRTNPRAYPLVRLTYLAFSCGLLERSPRRPSAATAGWAARSSSLRLARERPEMISVGT